MTTENVNILDGNTFVVTDRRGDIDASPTEPQGLFQDDTRFLSQWVLLVDDRRLNVLSVEDLHYYEAQHFLVPGTGTIYVDSPVSIIRRHRVYRGLSEHLTIMNHAGEPKELQVRLTVEADFADLFEIKDQLAKRGTHYRRVDEGKLVLGYRRDRFCRETWITSSQQPEYDAGALRFRLQIPPHGEWSTHFLVETVDVNLTAAGVGASRMAHLDAAHQSRVEEVERWRRGAPTLASSWRALESTYERSIADLAALRFYPYLFPSGALPAAGLPWFMAIFGRDSLITSLQALPFMPDLARTTLVMLSEHQGARHDAFRDEEPTATATGMWSTNARTRTAAWRTNVGRIHGTPSATRTAVWRRSRARPAKSRATSTTPRCAALGSPGRSGRTVPSQNGSRRKLPT
jgi:glycogen debranching enzyme